MSPFLPLLPLGAGPHYGVPVSLVVGLAFLGKPKPTTTYHGAASPAKLSWICTDRGAGQSSRLILTNPRFGYSTLFPLVLYQASNSSRSAMSNWSASAFACA